MTTTPAHPAASASTGEDDRSSFALVPQDPAGQEVDPDKAQGHEDPRLSGAQPVSGPLPVSLLVYSDNVEVRTKVRMAIGKRLASDLPPVTWKEVATPDAVVSAVDAGGFDVLILDGEASPAGGMGLCRQLKDEIYQCPPVLVLTGRPQDAWLATWSRADAAVPHPLDPRALAEAITVLARRRRG